MNEIPLRFSADDGFELAGTLYETRGGQRGISVLVNAATGVARSYYAPYARFLADQGFSVLTYDYRLVGDSVAGEWSGAPPTMQDWGERDTAAAIDWLRRERPQYSIVCVGHSFGGSALGLAWNNHQVRGLLGVAAQSSYWKLWAWWPPHRRLLLGLLWAAIVPLSVRWLGYFPGARFGLANLPAGMALNWARWCRDPNYLTDHYGRPLRQYFEAYRGRVRLYCFSDDQFLAPRRAVETLAGYYKNAGLEMVHARPADWGMRALGHFGFFQPSTPRRVWQETADWLLEVGRVPKPEVVEV